MAELQWKMEVRCVAEMKAIQRRVQGRIGSLAE
jgi:hypothetical protein